MNRLIIYMSILGALLLIAIVGTGVLVSSGYDWLKTTGGGSV